MYYLIYKVTNTINGKIYIGSHKTSIIDDGYMGSGTYLKRAMQKHGIECFEKEILFVYDNPTDMYAKEAELVNADFLAEENTYNMRLGGSGGFDYINANPDRFLTKKRLDSLMPIDEVQKKYKEKLDTDPIFREKRKEHAITALGIAREKYPNGTFNGRAHSDETKEKMRLAKIDGVYSGENNPSYGTMWIYNTELKQCKKISKDDVIPLGWHKGRKMKFD